MGVRGLDKHLARLRRLSAETEAVAGAVVYEAADTIRAEAFRSISAGSISGTNHVASAPGQAPNRDTGVLQAHIKVAKTGKLSAEVRSEAPYAAALEFGTSKMAARPYMRPARDKMAPKARQRMAEQIDKLVKRSG